MGKGWKIILNYGLSSSRELDFVMVKRWNKIDESLQDLLLAHFHFRSLADWETIGKGILITVGFGSDLSRFTEIKIILGGILGNVFLLTKVSEQSKTLESTSSSEIFKGLIFELFHDYRKVSSHLESHWILWIRMKNISMVMIFKLHIKENFSTAIFLIFLSFNIEVCFGMIFKLF